MRGEQLPIQDHISRYCAPKTTLEGQPTGASFMLRQNKDEFLSVNWLEYFGDIGIDAQMNKIREYIEISPAASGLFAILNVGEIIDQIQRICDKQLAVLSEPTPGDPSHCGVHGYRYDDDLVADLIANFVLKTYPAKKP